MGPIQETDALLPTLSTPTRARLCFLQCVPTGEIPSGPLYHLHAVRSIARLINGRGAHARAYAYYEALPSALKVLRDWASKERFDVIVRAPSRRHDAEPFVAAIQLGMRESADDLSSYFSKQDSFRAGAASAAEAAVAAISCALPSSELDDVREVLVVDDIFSKGYTAAAIVTHLSSSGLHRDARIAVCVALRMNEVAVP